jgi:hypothetical protein
MELKAGATGVCYAVCLDGLDVDVCDLDDVSSLTNWEFEPLEILDKIPDIANIDWNGHFGNYVYFRVDGHTVGQREKTKQAFLAKLAEILEETPKRLAAARAAAEEE